MQWLVLLEAERGHDLDPVDAGSFRRLVAAFTDRAPGALHGQDRYALQFEVEVPGASEAVRSAILRWEAALQEAGLPRWELIRVEALTRDEFEHEVLIYDRAAYGEALPLLTALDAGRDRVAEELVLRQAFHDPLTDLASQSLFRSYIDHTLAWSRTPDERCALLLFDVDRFADLNEQLGRSAADSVLVTIARRVASTAGPRSKVARMGGDQFGVLRLVHSTDEAPILARQIVAAIAAPIVAHGTGVHATASAGIAIEEDGDTGDALLARATLALRTAQEGGGGRYELYSHAVDGADVRRLEAEREAMITPDTNSYLALLERLSHAVDGTATLEEAASVVLRHVCDDAGFPVGRLYIRPDDGDGCPVPAGAWVVGSPERLGPWAGRMRVPAPGGLADCAFATRAPIHVRDIASEPGVSTIEREAAAKGIRGAVAVPVVVDRVAVAVLEFYAEQALESCDALLSVLSTVAAQLATVARRSRADAAAERAEARLRTVVENSGVWVKILGPDGRLQGQYPVTWPEDTELPLSAVDFVHPGDLAVAVRGWADALASPGPHPPFECRIRRSDGSWQWVAVTAYNMLDDPAVAGIVTYAVDAESRKRPEEARQRCEALLREAQALGRLGSWEFDLVTGQVEWSDELYRILGLEPGEAEPSMETLFDLAHPDDRPRLEEQRRLLWSGAGQALTYRVPGADGKARWISAQTSARRDNSGRVVALRGTAQDVTERRELERVACETERRLHEVEALAGVGSWHADAGTGCTTWSPELYEILGLDPAKVMPGPESFRAVVHPDDRFAPGVQALCQRGLATVADFECRIVRPDGDIRRIRVRSSATRNSSGSVTGYHGVVREAAAPARDESIRT